MGIKWFGGRSSALIHEKLVLSLLTFAMGESFTERLHLPYYDYIPQRGLKNLAKYKYSGLDLSLFAKYILHPFWTWLANYIPEWPAYVHTTLFHIN